MTDAILWWLRVGAKLMLVVPRATVALVFLGFISQVAMLASFLVPLKVIMMLGTGSEISLPFGWFSGVDHEVMVLFLSGLSVAFYLCHLASGRFIEHIAEVGSSRLLEQTSKVVLFENQEQVAANAYKRYTGTLSRLLFSFLAGAVIGFLYPEVLWLVLGASVVLFLTAVFGFRVSRAFRSYLSNQFPKYANVASGVVFLGVFGLVVSDFLWFTAPSFLVAIIGLILGRQLLAQLTEAAVGIRQLVQQKKKISVLFFSGEVFHHPRGGLVEGPWELMMGEGKLTWLDRLISTAMGRTMSAASVRWLQSGVRGVIFLDIEMAEHDRRFIVKIFDKNRGPQALHEASLLIGAPEKMPAPRLIDASVVSGFHVHVMDVSGYLEDTGRQGAHKETIFRLRQSLLAYEPPTTTVERYLRSKPMLWDRLDPEIFEILRIVASSDEQPVIRAFRERIHEIRTRLRSLPLCLHNPVTSPGLLFFNPPSGPKHLHWGQWSVEPTGAGWPCDAEDLREGAEQLEHLVSERPSLRHAAAEDFELAALMFELERQFRRENLWNCLQILQRARPLLAA